MTPAQQKAIDQLRALIVEHHSCGNPDKYEFKQFEIRDHGSFVSLVTEYGRKSDEGTYASLICRDHRHFFIRKRGKIELSSLSSSLKMSNPKNVSGAFESVIWYHKD
jgi:hypothetical protein